MKEVDIVYNIALVLFSISFAWMVNERINNFPKIRRFEAIIKFPGLLGKNKGNLEKRRRIKSDFLVFSLSWPVILISLVVSIEALSHYYNSYCSHTIYQIIAKRYIIPFLFLVAPQLVSRLMSSLVLWLAKDEILYLWENDKTVFNIFSFGWKQEKGLTDEEMEIGSGKIHKNCKIRAFGSLFWLAIIYFLIFTL